MAAILIISRRPSVDSLFPGDLRDRLTPFQADHLDNARTLLVDIQPQTVIIDVDSYPGNGQGSRKAIEEFARTLPRGVRRIFLVESVSSQTREVKCITLPASYEKLMKVVREEEGGAHSAQMHIPLLLPESGSGYPTMIKTRAAAMREVLGKIALVAGTETTVLLTGETGTGKGVVARLIHDCSKRHSETMMNVHCGAIPEPLIESELFGHAKGSFTGAIKTKKGKFEQVSKGTIFLDEIGTITAAIQVKLLQVLQDRTFQPIGSNRTHTTDVRIIAATNSDLGEMANRGEFRSDLYYRLNVFPVEVPPLRERREDIPLYIDYFLERFSAKHGKQLQGVTDKVLRGFDEYDWPGNVRELENLLERACVLADDGILNHTLFPSDLLNGFQASAGKHNYPSVMKTLAETRNEAIRQAEYEYLCALLSAHNGKIEASARTAGVSRRQIHKLLKKHHILKEDFKVRAV